MHISRSRIAVAALVVGVGACAGRAPQPVAVIQPQGRFAVILRGEPS